MKRQLGRRLEVETRVFVRSRELKTAIEYDGTRPMLAPVPAKSDVLPYKNSEGPLVFIGSDSEGGTAAVAGSGISDEERDLVLRVGK